jgi:hypothetical protein
MKAQLKQLAQDMFAAHPSVEAWLVTTDNQFFTPEQANSAKAHQDYLNRPTEATTAPATIRLADLDAPSDEEVEAATASSEVVPTEKSTAKQIADYLTSKGVQFDATLKKADLVVKLNEYVASLSPAPQQ